MALRFVTTDPRPSNKSPDLFYVRYDDRTPAGTEKTFCFPKCLIGIIKKGWGFDDLILKDCWDDQIKASVLRLDFDGQVEPGTPHEHPQLPPDPEAGWSDPDHLTAFLPEPVPVQTPAQHSNVIPNRGVTPQTARKHAAAERAAICNMPASFLDRLETLCKGQLYIQKRLCITEKPRAMEAQKILMAAWIDWRKESGSVFTEDEEKAMQF